MLRMLQVLFTCSLIVQLVLLYFNPISLLLASVALLDLLVALVLLDLYQPVQITNQTKLAKRTSITGSTYSTGLMVLLFGLFIL